MLTVILALLTSAHPAWGSPRGGASPDMEMCAVEIPEGYRVETGYFSSEDEAAAKMGAKAAARAEARDILCGALTETRCQSLLKNLVGWKDPRYDTKSNTACAHVAIHRTKIKALDAEQDQLESDMKAFASVSASSINSSKVVIRPPIWRESRCHVGGAGGALVEEIRMELAKKGVAGLDENPQGQNPMLEVTYRRTDQSTYVAGQVLKGSSSGVQPIPGGFSFPNGLFGEMNDDAACFDESRLGLEGGERIGPSGARLTLSIDKGNTLCAGDRAHVKLHVNQPVFVKVFSMHANGEALHVWPPQGKNGFVDSSLDLGEFQFFESTDGTQQKLVAVGVDDPGKWGSASSWSGVCTIASAYDHPAFTSAGSSASALSIGVLSWDDDTCLAQRVQQVPKQSMPDFPGCL